MTQSLQQKQEFLKEKKWVLFNSQLSHVISVQQRMLSSY